MRPAVSLLVATLLAASALGGCVKLSAAHVPAKFLTSANAWEADEAASDDEPSSAAFGTTRTQRLSYRDDAEDDKGYPGRLSVYTVKTLVTPSEESLRDQVQSQVRALVEEQGIRLDAEAARGSRALANKAESLFFVYNGTVTQTSGLFTQNSKAKIVGEVFQCRSERSAVVAVAITQVTTVRTLGGVTFPANNDATTWREVVADPKGTIEGVRGSDGLLFNVACS